MNGPYFIAPQHSPELPKRQSILPLGINFELPSNPKLSNLSLFYLELSK